VKDLLGLGVFLIVFAYFVFYIPNYLNDPTAYIAANPLQTPAEVVPQWYFLPFFAILRSIPDKLTGVIAMFSSIFILFFVPWLDRSPVRSARFRPVYKQLFWLLVVDVFVLGWVGAHPPAGIYLLEGRAATLYYFFHFLILTPIVGKYERPLPLPATIATPVLSPQRKNNMNVQPDPPGVIRRVSIRQLAFYFLQLGALGFGGPVALVGQMERDLVQEKHWLTKEEMRDSIAVSQALPGPLAIQVGIFVSYLRCGFWGAWAGGAAFILPNFILVAVLGALYRHFGDLPWMTAIFYGVSPAVIALILHSCWRLAKLGMEDWLQWLLAAACFVITVTLRAEVALLFVGAGAIGILYYGSLFRSRPKSMTMAVTPLGIGGLKATPGILIKLFVFFLKAGALTFGSGLVIVPFLEKGLVEQTNWLTGREFLVAVAVGMISPGPVVITATFVGSLVDGFWGALIATVGIFLPSFLLILIVAPILVRHRANPNVRGFIKGAYAAAIGTILGACVLLAKIAIGDWLTALIAVVSLALLFRFKIHNALLVAATAVIGLIAFPLLQPVWVFVK
jgi:chromate transporter